MPKIRSNMNADLRRFAEANAVAQEMAAKEARARARTAERERIPFTRDQLVGATHVRFAWGWAKVARLNRESVAVETKFSWTDRYPIYKVLEFKTLPFSERANQ